MARIMNDVTFSRVLRSENMIMVYFQCFKVKLTLKGRVKLFFLNLHYQIFYNSTYFHN